MQIAAETTTYKSLQSLLCATYSEFSATTRQPPLSRYKMIRRNGAVAGFEPFKISEAVTKDRHVRFRFGDGLAGSIFPDDVLEGRAFGRRPDAAGSCKIGGGRYGRGSGGLEWRNPAECGNSVSGPALGQAWQRIQFVGACPDG